MNNVNNDFIKNESRIWKCLSDNTNVNNFNKINLKNNNNKNICLNQDPHFNIKFVKSINSNSNNNNINYYNNLLFYYNLIINNYDSYLNEILKNKNNLINSSNNNNNIKNERQNINEKKCSNLSEKTLTSLLCDKKKINEIKKIIKNNPNYIDIIRKIILSLNEENGLHKVFENIYGNYFIQELFEKMNNDLIQLTIDLISSEFVNIAKTSSGTHCLQKLLDYVNNSEMEISIIKAIRYKEKEMAFDNNATYVLQKIISIIPDKKRIRLNNFIIDNAKELSLNSNSVFVLKKFISTISIEENKNKLIYVLKKSFLIISQNPFGNYVIQYLLEAWSMKECELIIQEIYDKIIDLSTQKFSSNIISKAFVIFDNFHKNELIKILLFSSNILILIKNKYGNFVINKAIKNMDNKTKEKFEIFLVEIMKNIPLKDKLLLNQLKNLL